MIRILAAGKSVKGPVRKRNEDALFLDPDQRLFLVADGMGGQRGGERASQLAMNVFAETICPWPVPPGAPDEAVEQLLRSAIVKANSEIMSLASIEPAYHGMGTTIVFAYFVPPDRAYVGGIGDSRCYYLRNNQLRQLTEDHSVDQYLRKHGLVGEDRAMASRFRNTLWNYLGTKEAYEGTDILVLAVRPRDRMLLTTDGLTSVVSDREIAELLQQASTPDEAVSALVGEALAQGSRDNITCVVIFFEEAPHEDQTAQ